MMHHFDAVYVGGEYIAVVDGAIDGKGLKCEMKKRKCCFLSRNSPAAY